MTYFESKSLSELQTSFDGELIRPEDTGYDNGRSIWNASIDKSPALIGLCTGLADVITLVRFARQRNLPVAIRSGGHNHTGHALADGGVVIDLSRMCSVNVNPVKQRAYVQGGATWANIDHETQAFGLATTDPIVAMTGVGGFTLGWGLGWLQRQIGLAIDNLLSVNLVTAEGDYLCASQRDNPDLFWGLRGGGGNFGVATSFEFQLHPIGKEVVAGLIYYPIDKLHEFARFYNEFSSIMPDELSPWLFLRLAPVISAIPEAYHSKPVFALALCYVESESEAIDILKPLRSFATPLLDTVQVRSYRNWQRALDFAWGDGFHNDWRTHNFDVLTPEIIDILIDYTARITSPNTDIKIPTMGGQIARINHKETAFSSRDIRFPLVIQTRWRNPEESDRHLNWAHQLWDALEPHASGTAYSNFLPLSSHDDIQTAYGSSIYKRLMTLKLKYDPSNTFRLNQNIELPSCDDS